MGCYSEVIGYHANEYQKCDRFLSGEFEVSSDTDWLGTGMYFWDNLSNARYWKRQKVRKGDPPYEEACKIVKARISCGHLLDLTDTEILKGFCGLWQGVKNKIETEKRNRMGFGQKIDFIISFYSDMQDDCLVVKALADYSGNEDNCYLFKSSNFLSTVKTIYSVRDDSVIDCREEVKND